VKSDQYDSRIRPGFPNGITNITVGFSVLTIEDLQIEDMAFNLEIFLIQKWFDPRLEHKHGRYLDGSNFLDDVWVPDTYFKETTITEKRTLRQFEEKKSLLRIRPNGELYYSTRESLRLSCGMNLKMFPVDVQRCNITIGSYGYESSEIRYSWLEKSHNIYTFKNKSLSHYEIDPMSRAEEESEESHGKWSKLKATITFRRKTSAFIPAMYFPCTVIVIVSWITFFIHPDHFPARTNLCAVSVLTIITLQGGMSNTLPKVSYIKSIDMYVMGCVLFVACAFVEYAIVLLLQHKKDTKLRRRNAKKEMKAKMLGDTALLKDDGKKNNVITKVTNTSWAEFYLKDQWPLVLDEYSRLFFPVAFAICTITYWATAMNNSNTFTHSDVT